MRDTESAAQPTAGLLGTTSMTALVSQFLLMLARRLDVEEISIAGSESSTERLCQAIRGWNDPRQRQAIRGALGVPLKTVKAALYRRDWLPSVPTESLGLVCLCLPTDSSVLRRGDKRLAMLAAKVNVLVVTLDGATPEKLASILKSCGVSLSFVGAAANGAVAVVDKFAECPAMPERFRVEALMATYNEVDIARQTIEHLLDQGVEVTAIDDWSWDGTWEVLNHHFGSNPCVKLVRNGDRPSTTYNWESILKFKERLAEQSKADWLVHHDADEIRATSWPGVNLREGFWRVDCAGFSVVDHTVIDFRPIHDGFCTDVDPQTFFEYFEFGSRPGHFAQLKAWARETQAVDLSSSGGHEVRFDNSKVFPYKFLIKHYPLRSDAAARTKIFRDRLPRAEGERSSRGWHTHYDTFKAEQSFLWQPAGLLKWDQSSFGRDYMLQRIAGIGVSGSPTWDPLPCRRL